MNFYPFHVGDYMSHTPYLTLSQDMAYRRLLDLYYLHEKPIKGSEYDIAQEIGMLDYCQAVEIVLKKFFIKDGDTYSNKRCDKVISEYQAKSDRAKFANKSRWDSNIRKESDIKQGSNGVPTITRTITKTKEKESTKEKKSKYVETPISCLVNTHQVELQIAKDWIKLRNIQKAPVTETVIRGFKQEAIKANLTLNQVLTVCIDKSWRGFKAEWLKNAAYGSRNLNAPDTTQSNTNSQWRLKESTIMLKGQELNTPRKRGESLKVYRSRLDQIIKESKNGVQNS